jgi:quercetin dioxygenase-like cupin family protein
MMKQILGRSRSLRLGRSRWLLALAALVFAAKVWATPSLGFVVNQILAAGLAVDGISQHIQINRNPDGTMTPWQLQLQVQGDTDHYSQHLVLSPGGYSGWHSHPGVLIATVKSGQIDFYDADCRKRTIGPGKVYTEDDRVHAISNTGVVDADLYISYLVKHGAARRRDESAPACAVDTGIP